MMRSIALLTGLLLWVSAAAPAQTHRNTVLVQLDAVTQQKRSEGFSVDTRSFTGGSLVGLLPKGGYVVVEVNLMAGRRYFIPAGCDRDCTDLDTDIRTPGQSKTIDEDTADDDVPMLSFRAAQSGPHLLRISMPGCRTDVCYFGLRVLTAS